MKEEKQEAKIAKLTLENHHEHYRVYIEIEPGADIPPNLRELIISIAREDGRKLSETEIQLIENIFRTDIHSLEDWEQLEVKKALVMSNVGIRLKSGPALIFDGLFQLPRVFHDFTGRKKELEDLDTNSIKPTVITQKIAGNVGVGKTQLMNRYARLKIIEGYYKWVVWLRGGKIEEEEGYSSQFTDLGSRLGINVKLNQGEKLKELVYQQLTKRGNGLLIIDGAVDYVKIKVCLPQQFNIKNIRVLMSSQDTLNWGNEVENITLGVFKPEDALDYIKKTINLKKYEEEGSKLLAEMLGNSPLAITQAITYINNNPITIKEFIELFKTQKENQRKLLDYPPFKSDDHQQTIYATVLLSFEKINEKNVNEIIFVCSHLAPETPISVNLLLQFNHDSLDLNNGIENLRKYGLVSDSSIENCIEMQQVIQMILMLTVGVKNRISNMKVMVNKLSEYLKLNKNLEMRTSWILIQHLRRLLIFFEEEVINSGALELQRYMLVLLSNISNIYEKFDDYIRAKKAMKDSLELLKKIPSNSDVGISLCEMSLSELCYKDNDFLGAKYYIESALSKLEKTDKSNDRDVIQSRKFLEHLNKIIELQSIKSRHESNLQTTNDDFNSRFEMIKKLQFEKLIPLILFGKIDLKEVDITTKIAKLISDYDELHPEVIDCEMKLGCLLLSAEEYEKCITHCKKLLSKLIDIYGEQDVKVANCHLLLASALRGLSQYDESIKHLDININNIPSTFDERHPLYIRSVLIKGLIHLLLKKIDEAENCIDRANKITASIGESDSDLYVNIQFILVCILYVRKKYVEAKDALAKTKPLFIKYYGETNQLISILYEFEKIIDDSLRSQKIIQNLPIIMESLDTMVSSILETSNEALNIVKKYEKSASHSGVKNKRKVTPCLNTAMHYVPEAMIVMSSIFYKTELTPAYCSFLMFTAGAFSSIFKYTNLAGNISHFFYHFTGNDKAEKKDVNSETSHSKSAHFE